MIRITTLIENSIGEHLALRNEHGLSICIEMPGNKILFDAGQSGDFIYNAHQLQIDLTDLECVVLSHGHYDHTGGLRDLLNVTTGFELVTGRGFFREKYAERNGAHEYLGNNFTAEFLKKRNILYSELRELVRELVPGVFVVGFFPRVNIDEKINKRFKLLTHDGFTDDDFKDEVMIVVDTPLGLVAIMGCAHPGMRNMLDEVKSRFKKPVYAVLGGTHLVEASQEASDASIEYLIKNNIKIIGVSHCTGEKAGKLLENSSSGYFYNRTGSSLTIF